MNTAFEDEVLAQGILSDPYLEGAPRLAREPVVRSVSEAQHLAEVAESIAGVYDEVARLVLADPTLLDVFFNLTPYQKVMWQMSAPRWHAFGRVDLFETEDGIVTTEMNSDTPTGQAEAVALGALARTHEGALVDPNARLGAHFAALVETLWRTVRGGGAAPRTVGLVYPTDMTEDLPLVRLYEAWLARAGFEVVLGSPFNLALDAGSGRATLFGRPCALVLRHYKTDWWGERLGVWTDEEPYADAAPLVQALHVLATAEDHGGTLTLNPFGAVVTQHKAAMALMWEKRARFSVESQRVIQMHVPYTVRLDAMFREQVAAERDAWVLKSDYGAEGEEVIVGRAVSDETWARCLAHAAPGRWVVQKRFTPRLNARGESENLGVYVFGGRARGFYARRQAGATDRYAKSVAFMIAEAT